MALTSGTKLGPYEIVAPLGAGGMGEVYRARDTRLDRTVAVKILPAHLSSNPEARHRFEREARAISSLNHPNICTLHDIGRQDGTDFLVMEYLEGETLADRLIHGPLPTEQVLKYGVEICEGLEKAHKNGVIHRDLKPGNIMLTKSGAKLMDFGLAKATSAGAPPSSSLTMTLPSADQPLTAQGMMLGTFQYMSPEQVEGKEADARSDIFALGAVLYEMASGRCAFTGKSQASIVAAILASEPQPISAVQPMSPPALDRVVRTCLAKDPDDRWQTAHDVKLQLRWIAEGGSQAGVAVPAIARRKIRERLSWVLAAVTTFVAMAALVAYVRHIQPAAITARFVILPRDRPTVGYNSFAVSPDGRSIVFIAPTPDTKDSILWSRPLNSSEAQPLPGTEGAMDLFWSPEGQNIAFLAAGKLKRVASAGGTPQVLCNAAPNGGVSLDLGGTWSRDGEILFVPSLYSGILRVSSEGGLPTAVTVPDRSRHELMHAWPYFLPDGDHFLYFVVSNRKEQQGVYVGSLGSKNTSRVLDADSNAIYVSPGYLLFIREGRLLAQPFDAKRLRSSGEPFPVADQVHFFGAIHQGYFSASQNGVLAYVNAQSMFSHLVWVDRTGREVGTVGPPGDYFDLEVSPDERRVAIERVDPQNQQGDILVLELVRGILSQVTFTPWWEYCPRWSPDGTRILYDSNRAEQEQGLSSGTLYVKSADGAGSEELMLEPKDPRDWIWPDDWSRDGQLILYDLNKPSWSELWYLQLEGNRTTNLYLQRAFAGRFSPDARWVAYGSSESGVAEVYVRPFPPSEGKWQISTGGGGQILWRRDGKEIFYVAPDGKLMAATVKAGLRFEASSPTVLFTIPNAWSTRQCYAASHDGQRFLIRKFLSEGPVPINVVLNWTAELTPALKLR